MRGQGGPFMAGKTDMSIVVFYQQSKGCLQALD